MMSSLRRGVFFFLLFLIFTIPVSLGSLSKLDQDSIRLIQGWLPSFLDTPLSLFSLLGSFEITTLILLVVASRLGQRKAIIVLAIFGLGMGLELIGKSVITHPSPENTYFRYSLPVYFPSGSVQTGHSYPSGHSYRATFLTIFFAHFLSINKKISKPNNQLLNFCLYLALLTMLFSRVSLGEHWGSDVIGGALLGLSFAYFSIGSQKWQFASKSGKIDSD